VAGDVTAPVAAGDHGAMTHSDPRTGKNLVFRIERGEDPRAVYATTYQMRNFYLQLRDALPGVLDVMNYMQHYQVVLMAHAGDRLLDLCCGRGLLLPLLRYHRKEIGGYTGVDIAPGNAKFLTHRVTDNKPLDETPETYYPFPVRYVHADVADLSPLGEDVFDLIVYTSSIEHMHHDVGAASLVEARRYAAPKARLIVTTPNTPEDRDGFETQYRAHVYEWKLSELRAGLAASGWEVLSEWGLEIRYADLLAEAERFGLRQVVEIMSASVPRSFLTPVWASMFPDASREVALLCRAVER
jgi:SAM-dependent methyltransferase